MIKCALYFIFKERAFKCTGRKLEDDWRRVMIETSRRRLAVYLNKDYRGFTIVEINLG